MAREPGFWSGGECNTVNPSDDDMGVGGYIGGSQWSDEPCGGDGVDRKGCGAVAPGVSWAEGAMWR